jgi:hypothetical protein
MPADIEMFLGELKALRDKYHIEIHGCGCCPALYDSETLDIISERLTWDNKTNKYKID